MIFVCSRRRAPANGRQVSLIVGLLFIIITPLSAQSQSTGSAPGSGGVAGEVGGTTTAGAGIVNPEIVAVETEWADHLQEPKRTDAQSTARLLESVERSVETAKVNEVRNLEKRRLVTAGEGLELLTTLPFPRPSSYLDASTATASPGSSGVTGQKPSMSDPPSVAAIEAARAHLAQDVSGYLDGVGTITADEIAPGAKTLLHAGMTVTAAESVQTQLLANRDAEIIDGAPDAGTAGYGGLERALIDFLTRHGIAPEPLGSVSQSIDELSRTAADVPAMRTFVHARGTDVSRPPAADDVSGWRFLFSQALGTAWIHVLASSDLRTLSARMGSLAGDLSGVSTQVADELSSLGASIEADSQAIDAISDYLGGLWASIDLSQMVISSERGGALPEQERFLHEIPQISRSALEWYTTAEPLFAAAIRDLCSTIAVLDTKRLGAYRASVRVSEDELRAVVARMVAARTSALTRTAATLEASAPDSSGSRTGTFSNPGAISGPGTRSSAGATGGTATPSSAPKSARSSIDALPSQSDPAAVAAVWPGASAVLKQADQSISTTPDSPEARWNLLSLLENRAAAYQAVYGGSYAALARAYERFLSGLYQGVDQRAASILASRLGTGSDEIQSAEVYANPEDGREVAFYRTSSLADGTKVEVGIPVDDGWSAYAQAFYEETHTDQFGAPSTGTQGGDSSAGSQTTAGTTAEATAAEMDRWARVHGQAVVPYGYDRTAPGIRLISSSEAERQLGFAGSAPEVTHTVSTLEGYLGAVVNPWQQAATAVPTGGNSDRLAAEFLDRGFAFFLHHISEDVLPLFHQFGLPESVSMDYLDFASLDLIRNETRFAMQPANALRKLSEFASREFGSVAVATNGGAATAPSEPRLLAARQFGLRELVTAVAEPLLQQYAVCLMRSIALRDRGLDAFLSPFPGESALEYGERGYRRVYALADLGVLTEDAYASARDNIMRSLRSKAADAKALAAVGAALFRLRLISAQEYRALNPAAPPSPVSEVPATQSAKAGVFVAAAGGATR